MAPEKFRIQQFYQSALYDKREASWNHVPYERELIILEMVKRGDVERLHDITSFFVARDHLSKNALRQRQYEMVASATLVTRWAVEGGLDIETAYSLADAYINAADSSRDAAEILALIRELPLHFAALVRERAQSRAFSRPIIKCVEYIESNLHSAITLGDLAAHVGRNASYLSVLFKKETGQNISAFILKKRLDEAQELLANTEMPISQIADTLMFNSQSYFTAIFLKQTGETPGQFRKRVFRNHRKEK